MERISVAILGAAGRMGRMLVAEAASAEGISLAAAIENPSHPAVGRDAGEVAGLGAPIGVSIAAPSAPVAADVFIDFSFHTAVILTSL